MMTGSEPRIPEAMRLEEHRTIRAATLRLGGVARAEGNAAVARLAEKLVLHAQSEEEVFYPAAVLVGDLVRARAGRGDHGARRYR